IDSGAVAVLARAAEGSVRDGLSLLEQSIAYCGDAITDAQVRELLGVVAESVLDDLVEAIAAQSSEKALSLAHRLIADGQNLQHFCREAIRHFRNLLVAHVCGADSRVIAAPADERPRLARQAAQFSEEDLTRFFNILVVTEDDVRRKPDPRLHLELGLLKLINAQRLAPLEEAIAELHGERPPAARAAAPARHSEVASASSAVAPAPSEGASAFRAASAPAVQSGSSSGAAVRMALETETPAPRSNAETSPSSTLSSRPSAAESPASQVAPAAPGVRPAERPIPASPPRVVARAAEDSGGGLASARVDSIKAALQGQKFLWSMIEHASRWELDSSELRLFFPAESRALAEMLQARDPMERLRTVLNQVLGEPLRVCVRLESGRVGTAHGAEIRARFEEDPIVRAMLQKFGGRISTVKRSGED
ncbi:MAG: hypothetical protein KGL02_14330, partial [Acidobacteriota bacterium]|nr:hypothetical protein [Acidobacteriota bacterium]